MKTGIPFFSRTLGAAMLAAALGLSAMSACAVAAEPVRGGTLSVATIGEPPTLDPMSSTGDIVGTITQHIFETLYTFDDKWNVTPLLAETMPVISADGLTYTIALRTGITFHDGEKMDSADVLASLKRWTTMGARGKQAGKVITAIEAPDDHTIKITLSQPYAPLLALLAMNNSAAIVLPKSKLADPLTEFVGTGPYMLKARVPDQYIQLVRFDNYRSRDGKPDGYGGARKQYLDEIRFVPVANANTRVEGAVAGQFDYVDSLPVESLAKVRAGASEPVMLKPFGWPRFVMNTKTGVMANLKLRQAVQMALNEEDMLFAAFGGKDFYTLNGALYPTSYPWATDAGVKAYNQADAAGAKKLIADSGVANPTIRILTSQQYDFHYKMALVAAEYLKQAGFKVDMQVVDWATLIQRRSNADLWDIFISHSPFLAEPGIMDFPSKDAPGWWDTPARNQALDAFNKESDPAKRVKLFAEVQKVVFAEVPFIKIGDFNALAAQSRKVQGLSPEPWPFFWNAWKTK